MRALEGWEGLRLPPSEHLHATLAFLGDRPEAAIDELARVGLTATEGGHAPVLSSRAVVGVPRRRPRLLALDLDDPDGRAAEAQAAVVGALAAAGLHEPERRPFWPHLTLARIRGAQGRGGGPIVDTPRRDVELPSIAMAFDRVTLFRSRLHPSGARYEAIDRRQLAPPGE